MFCAFLTLIRGCPIYNNRTNFKLGRCSSCVNRIHPKKNQFTNFGEESVGVRCIHGVAWSAQFLAPLLSEEGKKATDLKFCTHIHRVDWNKLTKGHEKFRERVAMGVVIMQGVPKIFGALRGHLCDSIAFLSSIFTRFRNTVAFVLQHATFSLPHL